MNKEIKEILDMFIKYKDEWYSCEYILKPKQCVMLLDYITNLEQENKEQFDENCKLSKWLVKKQKRIEELEQKCAEHCANEMIYKSRNEKAIEYIKANRNVDDYDKFVIEDDKNILLGILNGTDE